MTRGLVGLVVVGGLVVSSCAWRGTKAAGPVAGGWLALLGPDIAIAPGAVIAAEDLRSGDVKAICPPSEWLNPKEGEPLPELDLVGPLAPLEMRDELAVYVKAHAKGTKTPPLMDLRGRTIERGEVKVDGMTAMGYFPNTVRPWSRNGVKDTCLAAITSYEDGSMHDGSKWEVAVVTRVLVAQLARTDGTTVTLSRPDAGVADAGVAPPPPAGAPVVTRSKKGYLEGDGLVWAIQYQTLAQPK